MSEHYFSQSPDVESSPETASVNIKEHSFRFTTDRGVFSKGNLDFGTQLLIETFELQDGVQTLLDVGCGYGPIGISLATFYPDLNITMVDVNERALSLAKQNAEQNHVSNIEIKSSNLFENIERSYDIILSNPPIRAGKETVHGVFEGASRHLNEGGELWLVMRKKQGAPSAIEKLKTLFDSVEIVKKSKGYYIIRSLNG